MACSAQEAAFPVRPLGMLLTQMPFAVACQGNKKQLRTWSLLELLTPTRGDAGLPMARLGNKRVERAAGDLHARLLLMHFRWSGALYTGQSLQLSQQQIPAPHKLADSETSRKIAVCINFHDHPVSAAVC